LEFPDPKLRITASPIDTVNDELQKTIDDMFETMYAAPGIGLAATQVDIHKRLLVTDITVEKNQPFVMINPEVIKKEGNVNSNEGCLSIPGYQDDVERYEAISIKYLDRRGVSHEIELNGLLAICVQHEIDHLNGKLFVDYLSSLKRERLKKKVEKKLRYDAL
jgi:peptide deformylase